MRLNPSDLPNQPTQLTVEKKREKTLLQQQFSSMTKLFWVIAVLAAFVAVAGAEKRGKVPAPAPGADCSVLVYDMIDCISFISVGGSDEKPSESCCSGFKTVVKTDADCVCVALKSSGQLGINLNMTRVVALPSACGVSSSFSLSTCDVFAAPDSAPAPAVAPVPVPVIPTAPAPAPVPATVPVPAPGPDTPTESSPNTAPAPSPSPSPDFVWPPPPAAPVVEPPAVSPSDTNGGSSFNQSPAFSPESGTPSATVANPRLLVFCLVALAAAVFYYV